MSFYSFPFNITKRTTYENFSIYFLILHDINFLRTKKLILKHVFQYIFQIHYSKFWIWTKNRFLLYCMKIEIMKKNVKFYMENNSERNFILYFLNLMHLLFVHVIHKTSERLSNNTHTKIKYTIKYFKFQQSTKQFYRKHYLISPENKIFF